MRKDSVEMVPQILQSAIIDIVRMAQLILHSVLSMKKECASMAEQMLQNVSPGYVQMGRRISRYVMIIPLSLHVEMAHQTIQNVITTAITQQQKTRI